jgi:outer membrane autotransporter protein
MVGFALAGAGTSWGPSNNLGTGRSDVMQLGLYGSKQFGASYLSGALSYAWHSINTDRTVTVSGSDHLAANVDAHSFGGRVETGHHFVTAFTGVTPYAALQAQIFHTPSYSETAVSGSSAFALSYDARSTVATRTELSVWLDKTLPLDNSKVLALRAQAAWANDHSDHQGVDAAFQSLPASTFTVNGAAAATNLALLTAGTELRITNNVSLGAKLGGEFSSRTQTYSGTGTFRYVW